jgi:hypothetical protein
LLFVFAPAITVAAGVFVATAVVRGSGNKDTSDNSNGGVKKKYNQPKAAAAIVTETAMMTATSTTMKMKATVSLMAARHWQLQRAGGSKSAGGQRSCTRAAKAAAAR